MDSSSSQQHSDDVPILITLDDIVSLAGGPERACLVKGHNLYLSRMVNDVTLESSLENKMKITGAVTQTSYPKKNPHKVEIEVEQNLAINKISAICNCLAGKSEICKHIFSVLFKLHEEKVIRKGTCTDIPQIWDKLPKLEFGPQKIKMFCDVNGKQQAMKQVQLSSEEISRNIDTLIRGFPNSSFAKHKMTRKTMFVSDDETTHLKATPSNFFAVKYKSLEISDEFSHFYQNYVQVSRKESESLLLDLSSRNKVDLNRLADFQCFQFIEFSNNKRINWRKKTEFLFGVDKFRGNSPLMSEARKAVISRKRDYKFCGKFINPTIPFISCHLDCYIPSSKTVVKIMCLEDGEYFDIWDIVGQLTSSVSAAGSFLKEESGSFFLKDECAIYTLVQVQMFLTGSLNCNVMIYSIKDDDFLEIEVKIDETFAIHLIKKVEHFYKVKVMQHLLPAEKEKEEKQIKEEKFEKKLEQKMEIDEKIMEEELKTQKPKDNNGEEPERGTEQGRKKEIESATTDVDNLGKSKESGLTKFLKNCALFEDTLEDSPDILNNLTATPRPKNTIINGKIDSQIEIREFDTTNLSSEDKKKMEELQQNQLKYKQSIDELNSITVMTCQHYSVDQLKEVLNKFLLSIEEVIEEFKQVFILRYVYDKLFILLSCHFRPDNIKRLM